MRANMAPCSTEGSSWSWERACGRCPHDKNMRKIRVPSMHWEGHAQFRNTQPERFPTVSQMSWFDFSLLHTLQSRWYWMTTHFLQALWLQRIKREQDIYGHKRLTESRIYTWRLRSGCVDKGLVQKVWGPELCLSTMSKCWTWRGVHEGCTWMHFSVVCFCSFFFLNASFLY